MRRKLKYFFTDDKIKVEAISREQMIEVDRIAMEETGPNLWQMMENAGRNLSQLTIQLAGTGWRDKEIVVLSGKGNNGGGGICAARHLANHGANVKLVLADENNLGDVPAFQKKNYQNAGGKTFSFDEAANLKPDIILDAIIGYNLSGAPGGIMADMIKWANLTDAKIISLDIPSGIDSNTGETQGVYINAFATMTLALPKTGLLYDKNGLLYLADIGIPNKVYSKIGINYTSPFSTGYIVNLTVKNFAF